VVGENRLMEVQRLSVLGAEEDGVPVEEPGGQLDLRSGAVGVVCLVRRDETVG